MVNQEMLIRYSKVICYGHTCRKQRFRCKNCGHTLQGNAIDHSSRRLELYHQAAFDICHKILLVLQELPKVTDVCLKDVSKFDETFVLDC